jgi:hypothetical protein
VGDYGRVHRHVPTPLPEDDLFAGIRGREGTLES